MDRLRLSRAAWWKKILLAVGGLPGSSYVVFPKTGNCCSMELQIVVFSIQIIAVYLGLLVYIADEIAYLAARASKSSDIV